MDYVPAGLTRVSQQPIGATENTCLADGLCVAPDVLTAAMAVVGTIAFAVAFGLALSRLHEAREMLEVERDRTERERDAFESFVERVAAMSPGNPRVTDGGRATIGQPAGGGLTSVVDAYRETVLELDHYDEEYDDTLEEHMTAEFGEDVALAVRSSAVLSPQLQRTLCARGLDAKRRRESLLDALDAESSSLRDARSSLTDVDEELSAIEARHAHATDGGEVGEVGTVDEGAEVGEDGTGDSHEGASGSVAASAVGDWQQVHAAETRLDDVLESRQADIHEQRHVLGGGESPTALYEYVYDDLPTSYPILSVGTRFLERAASLRRDVSRSLVGH